MAGKDKLHDVIFLNCGQLNQNESYEQISNVYLCTQTVYSPLQKLISMIKHVYLSYEKIIPNKYGIKRLNCSQEFRVKVDLDRVFQISRKLPDHKRNIAWCTKNKSNRQKNTQF